MAATVFTHLCLMCYRNTRVKMTNKFRPDFFCFGASRIRNDALVINDFAHFKSFAGFGQTGFSFISEYEPDELISLSLKVKPFFNCDDTLINLPSCRSFLEENCKVEFRDDLKQACMLHDTFNQMGTHKIVETKDGFQIKLGAGVDQPTFFSTILNGLIFHFDPKKINEIGSIAAILGKNGLSIKLQEYVAALHTLCRTILKYEEVLRKTISSNALESNDVEVLTMLYDWKGGQKRQKNSNSPLPP